MPPKDTFDSPAYRPTARLLHWLIAALILLMIPAGQIMIVKGLPRGLQDALFLFHKNAGVVIGLLMLVRLGFRLRYPPPPLPPSVAPLQARIAGITHALLYLLVFVMVVSGYLRVMAGGFPIEGLDALGVPDLMGRNPGLETVAKTTHAITRLALVVLIGLHIGAALFHALWLRDGVMARMVPRRSVK
ncbi:cytochrome b [uncultured Thioclava sp.]|uniref:cytochrome b n=1 Tax=uncultured Thioclava sp. TaxID=473858 RepID=UPI0025F2D6BA|nr:cytochrome b [uncultured Thioclava sp.]